MNIYVFVQYIFTAAAAKSPQSCLTKCDPIRRQPTSLRRPWDSPGKNTGVGCHFLLQCMKVKSEREVIQSCPTVSDPMDCSPPGSSAHGIFQARVLEWGAIAFSNNLALALIKLPGFSQSWVTQALNTPWLLIQSFSPEVLGTSGTLELSYAYFTKQHVSFRDLIGRTPPPPTTSRCRQQSVIKGVNIPAEKCMKISPHGLHEDKCCNSYGVFVYW